MLLNKTDVYLNFISQLKKIDLNKLVSSLYQDWLYLRYLQFDTLYSFLYDYLLMSHE